MKLKYLFGIFVVILLAIDGLIIKLSIGQEFYLLVMAEALVLCSLVYLLYFYRKVVKPLNNIANGIDLLREQDFSSRLKLVGQEESDRIVEVFNRMMEQLKEERLRLREQNHFLDLLIEVSPMGVVILDFDQRITMLNKAALRFLNILDDSYLVGTKLENINTPLVEEILRIPNGKTETVRLSDAMIYRCSRLSFVDRGFAHPFVLIESLTSEVVKAEKKAYEKVIRMIAHEVNNTVGGVTSALDTVKSILSDMEDGAELTEVMTVCIERCMCMSRFITNFANVVKIPEPQLKPVALNDVVSNCRVFIESLSKDKQIDFRYELCNENPIVELDQVLFEQVLINITKNAVESIDTLGTVIVRTSAYGPTLEIADNGSAISRDVETKLFTPFFSTKPNGQGIGLLFIREVLDGSKCSFSLRTYSDGWTKFQITFGSTSPLH